MSDNRNRVSAPGSARSASSAALALTGGSVLAVLVVIAALSWFYLARNDDWRGWVFAGPSTLAVLAILVLRRVSGPRRRR